MIHLMKLLARIRVIVELWVNLNETMIDSYNEILNGLAQSNEKFHHIDFYVTYSILILTGPTSCT